MTWIGAMKLVIRMLMELEVTRTDLIMLVIRIYDLKLFICNLGFLRDVSDVSSRCCHVALADVRRSTRVASDTSLSAIFHRALLFGRTCTLCGLFSSSEYSTSKSLLSSLMNSLLGLAAIVNAAVMDTAPEPLRT